MSDPLLDIRDLRVEFRSGRERVRAVNGANIRVQNGEVVAVLGESGSGKSVTAAATLRLLQMPPASITGGQIMFRGRDVLAMPMAEWRRMLGRDVSMVLQDALAALNPVYSVGWQVAEIFRVHGETNATRAWAKAVDLLARVGIPDAAERAGDYPHQFSGGMRQRVMIAMAIALHPALLIADEPTTALDVTVQAQIMQLITQISAEEGTAVLLITHDLGVAMEYAEKVCVMYAGRVVETGPVGEVLRNPAHPYTLALVRSVPRAADKGHGLRPISGSPPDMARMPKGCPFHPRCEFATEVCRTVRPPNVAVAAGRTAECHHTDALAGAASVA